MKAGSLEKPEQFVVVDDHTFRVDFIRKDKLTLPDLGVPVPVDHQLRARARRTRPQTDPWAMEWLKNNDAGGGAYKVERWQPGQEVVYVRNDDWKNGPLPKIKRVIVRDHAVGRQPARPARARRRRHVVRPAAEGFRRARKRRRKLNVVGTPIENAMLYLGMNVNRSRPSTTSRCARRWPMRCPTSKIMDSAMFGRGIPLFGGADNKFKGVGLAAAARLQDRPRQGQGADGRGGLSDGLRDHAVVRPGLRQHQRAARHPDAGEPGADRHQDARSTRSRAPTGAASF